MINKDRIVPIQKVDFLTIVGIILAIAGVSYAILKAATVAGDFKVTGTGDAGNKLADQPVKTLDFASGVTAGTVYFCAAYDFKGITVNGAEAYADGSATIKADGITLYKAVLADSAVTVTAVSPMAD